jgi:hypothetical protein
MKTMVVRLLLSSFAIAALPLILVLFPTFSSCCLAFAPSFGTRHQQLSFLSSSRVFSEEHQEQVGSDTLEDEASLTAPWEDDALEVVRYYTETAIQYRGEPKGLQALETLTELCQNRQPYNFDSKQQQQDGTVVAPFRQLLSPNTTQAFMEQVRVMEENGWLSTNLDSVDGLPSLHLNLVSNGAPIVPPLDSSNTEGLSDFQLGTQRLIEIVQPHIYNKLLPEVNKLLNTTTSIRVSDIFLRRYGQDICGNVTRNGISAHYDVFSRVTSVIALDDTAAEGTNGLYTTAISRSEDTKTGQRPQTTGKTSNHASLRRFFPLNKGDGVVHTWDVLHGVDVEPGSDRTSLIVWFTTDEEEENTAAPWLVKHPDLEIDDVAQFVLASALESIDRKENKGPSNTQLSEKQLYLKSAAQGNLFALTRMGSLCDEKALSPDEVHEALRVLETLRPSSMLPGPIVEKAPNGGTNSFIEMAKRFWFEGAVRGNPLAQQALADELMVEASQTGNEDMRLVSAILFSLAAQQGSEVALESLSRVVDFDVSSRGVQSEEEFLASPVVQVARAATS